MSTTIKMYLEYKKTADSDWELFTWSDSDGNIHECFDVGNYPSFRDYVRYGYSGLNDRGYPKDMSDKLSLILNSEEFKKDYEYSWGQSYCTLEEIYDIVKKESDSISEAVDDYYNHKLYGMFKKLVGLLDKGNTDLSEVKQMIQENDEGDSEYYYSIKDLLDEYMKTPMALYGMYRQLYYPIQRMLGYLPDENIRIVFFMF